MNKKLDAKAVEKISKALGDPYRLKIIDSINKQKDWMQCVAINDMLNLAQSTVSHHIKQLVDADLLISDKDGRCTKYKVNKQIFTDYIKYLNNFGE